MVHTFVFEIGAPFYWLSCFITFPPPVFPIFTVSYLRYLASSQRLHNLSTADIWGQMFLCWVASLSPVGCGAAFLTSTLHMQVADPPTHILAVTVQIVPDFIKCLRGRQRDRQTGPSWKTLITEANGLSKWHSCWGSPGLGFPSSWSARHCFPWNKVRHSQTPIWPPGIPGDHSVQTCDG